MGKGIIYGFNTFASHTIIKIGRTEQTLKQRLKGYIGPSKPRTLIFHKEVDDSVAAENWVKILMSQCASVTQRYDLGDEWYESRPGISDEERNNNMLNISEVARLAVRYIHPPRACPPAVQSYELPCDSTLKIFIPGMEKYFHSLDRFVDEEPMQMMLNAKRLTELFESSSKCPVFHEYLPNTFEYRTSVVANRYPHLFQ